MWKPHIAALNPLVNQNHALKCEETSSLCVFISSPLSQLFCSEFDIFLLAASIPTAGLLGDATTESFFLIEGEYLAEFWS